MPDTTPSEDGTDWSWSSIEDDWVPPGIDPTKPSSARMYDFYLGGKDNYAADRAAAERVIGVGPGVREVARANRQFLCTAVERLARQGVEQFIDLGTGIPTRPTVHEVARRVVPDARVLYVDHDAVAITHARALLARTEGIAVLHEDLRRPDAVLDPQVLDGVIDLTRPVGLLMVAVLHFVDHPLATRVVPAYARALAPGSALAVSAVCRDQLDPATLDVPAQEYAKAPDPLVYRTRAEIEALFDGWKLQEPGVVPLGTYIRAFDRPERHPDGERAEMLCGVANLA